MNFYVLWHYDYRIITLKSTIISPNDFPYSIHKRLRNNFFSILLGKKLFHLMMDNSNFIYMAHVID